MIINHDETVLASSLEEVKAGQRAPPVVRKVVKGVVEQEKTLIDGKVGEVEKLFFSHRINVADKSWYF